MLKSPLVTSTCAEKVAEVLKRISVVSQVEMFGSVAETGQDADLDLILIVPDHISEMFFTRAKKYHGKRLFLLFRYGSARARLRACKEVLEEEFEKGLSILQILFPKLTLDIFLLPADWKERTKEFQVKMPHKNPAFMQNIAAKAREITSSSPFR